MIREPLEIAAALAGKPVRLGITWRSDDGEPGTVTLVQVRGGSAAEHAGLRVGDRIYEIAGQSIQDSDHFLKSATAAPSPVSMLIERRGRLRTISLDVPPPREAVNAEEASERVQ